MTPPSSAAAVPGRREVVEDRTLRGRAFCRALSDATDRWLVELFEAASEGRSARLALVAVGGYGRGELAPGSDLDLWLLHDGVAEVAAVAERLWYPVWDAGLKLGHAVRTPRQALALLWDDVDTATAALSARHLAGNPALGRDLAAKAGERSARKASRWLVELATRTAARHGRAGEVAFLLEPDVKEAKGGLRDVHSLGWAEVARPVLAAGDAAALAEAEEVLLDVRVELHRSSARPSDVLLLERQDDVAAALGDADADALMARVATAARTIAWTGDEVWARATASPFARGRVLRRRDRALGPGLVLRDGEVHVEEAASPAEDPTLVLRAAAAAAGQRARVDRASLDRLAAEAPAYGEAPWPAGAREALVATLATGRPAIPVLEAFDQRRLVERVLPEWSTTRSRPQRNALHRFTVDRHLLETVAGAAERADRVERPDLLLVGALLHDLGKGRPGDHTEVGVVLAEGIAARMGFDEADRAVVVDLVRHHLLLPEVATRRDLGDDEVIEGVAAAVGSERTLRLLAVLTEADSLATGPSAWGPWKAELLASLVARVAHVLEGGSAEEVTGGGFPGADVRALMADGATVVRGDGAVLTVVAPDRPGLFSRVAGALSLSGLTVLAADAASTEDGMAASQFRVAPGEEAVPWGEVTDVVRRSVEGCLALEARLAERARVYRRRSPGLQLAGAPTVRVDNGASRSSTVVEVRAPDRPGVLYRITRALAELDLDLRLAKVSTLGPEVVDAFYVRTRSGGQLTDPDHQRELERAILHSLSAP